MICLPPAAATADPRERPPPSASGDSYIQLHTTQDRSGLDSLTSVDAEGVKVHGLVGGLAVGQLLLPVLALGQVLHVEVQELVGVGAPVVAVLRMVSRNSQWNDCFLT